MSLAYCYMKYVPRMSNIAKNVPTFCCYFSAEKSNFVKNAKYLEHIKSTSIPDSAYENGRFMLTCQNGDLVFLGSNNQLFWQTFNCLPKSIHNLHTVILDVISEPVPQVCLFAADIGQSSEVDTLQIAQQYGGSFLNSRQALFLLNEKESQYVAQARGLINFGRSVSFCSACGGTLENKSAASHKQCTLCSKTYYPNISPVGITLIENQAGTEVLLVRQSRHPRGMFSCVAGFIEAGESLEENVRREIAEEVGLEVSRIEYVTSQHWAMPTSQLMLGCIATATSQDYELDPAEIQDGQWVSADILRGAVERAKNITNMSQVNEKVLWVPPPSAVAHQLMVTWLQRQHGSLPLSSHI